MLTQLQIDELQAIVLLNEIEDYQVRVIEELIDLDDRYENLIQFLSSDFFSTLDLISQSLLNKQQIIMNDFLHCLIQRIENFGIYDFSEEVPEPEVSNELNQ